MRSSSWLVGLLCATCVCPAAYSQESKSVMALNPGESFVDKGYTWTLHAKNNYDEPDSGGWVAARSNPKAFSIRFPAPYTYFSSKGKATDGVLIESHSIGAAIGGLSGTVFRVVCAYGAGRAGKDFEGNDMVEQQVKFYRSQSKDVLVRPVTAAAFSGQEVGLFWQGGQRHYQGRIVTWGDWMCDYAVDYPGGDERAPALVREFFSSFTVEK
jgi:hypothetical protein